MISASVFIWFSLSFISERVVDSTDNTEENNDSSDNVEENKEYDSDSVFAKLQELKND